MASTQGRNEPHWQADWIRFGWGDGAPLLRKRFEVNRKVRRAETRVTALGLCELRLNGSVVGDVRLMPGWTDYRRRLYYHHFDVTDLLQEGGNVIGGIIAPGWYAGYFGPFGDKGYYGNDAWFSVELELEYEDGSRELICSDSSWKGKAGPVKQADLLLGETYDARKEVAAWNDPDFDDAAWKPVALFDDNDSFPSIVEPYPGRPVRAVGELPAIGKTEPKPGLHVFDLGQNMVGVVRLKVNLPSGTEVVIRHGEMLNPDGTVYTENLRTAQATDRYIAKGDGVEEWQPNFTFHGFRYVEVSGLPGTPSLETITGVVLMSDLQETGSFECSDEKVNKLFSNIRWGFRGNYLEVPTDCPQRDERLGWTGDTQIFMRSATYLADVRPFFKKWLIDLHDAQAPDGGYPDMAPYMGRMFHASAAWADAGIICPYILWQAYGDTSFIRDWWPKMKQYMELICSENNRHNGPNAASYGDWLHINSETPVQLIGLAYRAYDARLMVEMAEALGESDDWHWFRSLEQESRALFRAAFFEGEAVAVKTQTASALAINMELLEGADLEKAKQCLFNSLENTDGYLTTGFVGTGYICPALTKAGRPDLAVQLLLNEEYPSWLYEVNNGATTIWERWNSWTEEDGFGDEGMNSFNHYAFGAVCEWMFESLAGIRPGSPGFQTLEIQPCLTERLEYVKASYASIQGTVRIHWKKSEEGYTVELETPVPARVHLPSLTESVAPGRHVFNVVSTTELIPVQI